MTTACSVSVDLSAVGRLLVVMPSWVGDATMATPLLRALRQAPTLRNATLVGYMRPGLEQLLAGSGLLDEMIVGRPAGALGPWTEGQRLKRGAFDAVILLPNSWRLAATVRIARIPIRIGYARDGRGWMLTRALPAPGPGGWKQPIPAVDYYLAIGTSLGIGTEDRQMILRASPAQAAAGEEILNRSGVKPGGPVALLNPGASKAEKRWPADRFASLADDLADRHGLRVLINGSPGERELTASICRQARTNPVDLAACGVSLGSLKHIAAAAQLLVTNDTGTRHIAAACANGGEVSKLGIVSLFGPTDPRWAQIEFDREKQISTGGAPIDEIPLETVRRACDELLGAPG